MGWWLSGDHKIFGDQMVVYADGFYQNVNTHNELAPPASGSFETKVRRYWLFRRIAMRQTRTTQHTHTRGDRFYRLMHSILLIPSSKYLRRHAPRVWLNLGTVCSITKLTHG